MFSIQKREIAGKKWCLGVREILSANSFYGNFKIVLNLNLNLNLKKKRKLEKRGKWCELWSVCMLGWNGEGLLYHTVLPYQGLGTHGFQTTTFKCAFQDLKLNCCLFVYWWSIDKARQSTTKDNREDFTLWHCFPVRWPLNTYHCVISILYT